jgi:von Willebrand factor type A domain/Aerotolerance regulator N-terminal
VILAGLPFATLALVFGVAAALVTALYILKLRRRTVATPFAPLWQRILRDKEATSLFSKLKRLLSLLVQLVLLFLLVAALGNPKLAGSILKGRTLVVLVDASASMQATDVSPNRLGVAKEHVKSMIRGLGGADRMVIAEMSAVVTPLGPMSGDTSELERALEKLAPTDTRADFPRALRFATDTLRGADSPEIVVVSDGDLGDAADSAGPVHLGDTKIAYVKVGKGNRNVGVTAFSVRRYPLDKSRYEVMLEVTNTGDSQEDIELTLSGDGQPVDITKLRLKPGERLPRFYPNLSGASRTLEARLTLLDGTKDDLPADDHAFALLPERRRAKVLVVTPGNTYLEAALLLDEYLDVTILAPDAYAKQFPAGAVGFDTVLFDAVTPLVSPRANAIYFDPRGPGSPVKIQAELEHTGFDHVDRKHPIVRFLALENVNVARAHKLVPEPGDKVVGASDEGPLLVAGTRGGYKFVALGFDVRDSDLPLRVAWPLFLVDTVNWFTDEDATYLSSFLTGEVWRIPVVGRESLALLTRPDGNKTVVPVHEGRAVYLGDRAGFYELAPYAAETGAVVPGAEKTAFAANLLDATESRIAPAETLVVDGKTAGPLEGFHVGVRREMWIYLLLAAVLLTVLEWATYHRRITV